MTTFTTTDIAESSSPETDDPRAVDASGFDDDEDLPARPVRRRLGPLTMILCGLLAAVGAFAGGVVVEKGHVASATTTVARAAVTSANTATGGAPARSAGAAGATAGAVGSGGGTGQTVGTVTLVDGANVYVTESGGTVVKIATTPASQVSVSSPGTTASIKLGDTVTASGTTGADGTVTAASLRDTGAGASGRSATRTAPTSPTTAGA